jgi:hypothetical protein
LAAIEGIKQIHTGKDRSIVLLIKNESIISISTYYSRVCCCFYGYQC